MGLISILDLQPIPIYDDDGIFENLLTEICDYLKDHCNAMISRKILFVESNYLFINSMSILLP